MPDSPSDPSPDAPGRPDGERPDSDADKLIRVVVTLSDEALADVEAVSERLREAGLEVTDVLEITGQVVGDWPGKDLAPLRALDGVLDASESLEIQLPPPGSLIQ